MPNITNQTFDGLAFPVARVRYTGNGYSATIYRDRDRTYRDDPDGEATAALCDAWEAGVSDTFEDACVTELRAGLAD